LTRGDEFFSRFGRFGGNMQLLKQLLSDDERMRTWVQSALSPSVATEPQPHFVSVNCSLSLAEMIRLGKYDNERNAIQAITEERFPVDRTGQLQYDKELFLIPPSRDRITTTEWKEELEANGWVLEQTSELLALGAKDPNLQLNNYIIAFGSSWRGPVGGDLDSPVLWSYDGRRGAGAGWCHLDGQWHLRDRALVSRKRR
jgi:hypothetical protein